MYSGSIERVLVAAIVLFDGVCRFCNASVNWLIDHDPKRQLRFAPLQSPTGQRLLAKCGLPLDHLDSLVVIEGKQHYTHSSAALRAAGQLGLPWKLGMGFLLMPAFLRDPVYEWIAANRYRWFGVMEACRVPTPEYRARFLE
ncbi:MAG: thiol-disulfide oxidoreductase DCC family protein [Planctomycetia bacterium]|nr:thiol-disulfide oxidoreductase DCC family protein [Planctomycetia bacterium]